MAVGVEEVDVVVEVEEAGPPAPAFKLVCPICQKSHFKLSGMPTT